jgi:hypothetical protein
VSLKTPSRPQFQSHFRFHHPPSRFLHFIAYKVACFVVLQEFRLGHSVYWEYVPMDPPQLVLSASIVYNDVPQHLLNLMKTWLSPTDLTDVYHEQPPSFHDCSAHL